MENSIVEVTAIFVIFLVVNLVFLRMIVKKKVRVTPVTLFDANGTGYTVISPGKIKIGPEAPVLKNED